jgi:Ca2+-binding EF-hand superfamily protein
MEANEIEGIINQMDIDGNGNINYTEFVNATIDK